MYKLIHPAVKLKVLDVVDVLAGVCGAVPLQIAAARGPFACTTHRSASEIQILT